METDKSHVHVVSIDTYYVTLTTDRMERERRECRRWSGSKVTGYTLLRRLGHAPAAPLPPPPKT